MLGYAQGSIAGVALEDANGQSCKSLILDAANLLSTVTASQEIAADGSVYTQTLATTKGRAFGIKLEFIPPDVLNDIIAAVTSAVEAGNPFNVAIADDITNFDGDCEPDFAAGWLKVAPQRTNTDVVKDAEFRFLTA